MYGKPCAYDGKETNRYRLLRATSELSCLDDLSIRTLSYVISRRERNERRENLKLQEEEANLRNGIKTNRAIELISVYKARLSLTKRSIEKYRNICSHPIVINKNGVFICPFCRKEVTELNESSMVIDLSNNKNYSDINQAIYLVREVINFTTQQNPKMTLAEFMLEKKKLIENFDSSSIKKYSKSK